jgi:hypothetical protein
MAALLLPLCLAISPVFAADPLPISVDDTSPLLKYDTINHWTTHVNVNESFRLYSNSDTFSDVRGAWVAFTFNGRCLLFAEVILRLNPVLQALLSNTGGIRSVVDPTLNGQYKG